MSQFTDMVCAYCKKDFKKRTAELKYFEKIGACKNYYCSRKCAGADRIVPADAKKSAKAEYDRTYRAENFEKRKALNQAFNKTPAGRAMQKKAREKRKEYQKAYVSTPRYKAWKAAYDRRYLATTQYGEFADAYLLLLDVVATTKKMETKYEIDLKNKRLGKATKRKRSWRKAHSGIA